MTRRHTTVSLAALSLATLSASGIAAVAFGADAPRAPTQASSATDSFLSLSDIQAQLTSRGIDIKEIEVRDKVLKIEGFNAQGREVELIVDRRSGETLSERFDD